MGLTVPGRRFHVNENVEKNEKILHLFRLEQIKSGWVTHSGIPGIPGIPG